MPCSAIDFSDLRLLAPEFIDLEPEYFDQAAQISSQVVGETCQWQTYLNALALQGFSQWLGEQEASLSIEPENSSIFQPQYASVIEAVCNLRIGEFKLCLIATESLLDEMVTIPRAAVDLPEFAAHFYVVIEVQEEQEQVIIRGYGRYDQLASYQQRVNLSADDRWNYSLPLSFFDAEPNHLLFNLRFLETAAISLPGAIAAPIPLTQAELHTVLSHLNSPEQRLWQTLSWEKGVSLLQNPELLELLYQWQQSPQRPPSLHIRITEVFTLLTQQAINTARWLRSELDEFSQSLGWSAQPLVAGVSEFRSPDRFRAADRFRDAIEELRYQGMEIPTQLSPVFQTIEYEGDFLQVCAAAWVLTTPDLDLQWALLLILRTQIGTFLPDGLKLRIADLRDTLSEAEAVLDTELLYVRADATKDTTLVATLVAPSGQVLSLAPYSFEPD